MKLLFFMFLLLAIPVYAHFTSYGDQNIIISLSTLPNEPPVPGEDSVIMVEVYDSANRSYYSNVDMIVDVYENDDPDPVFSREFNHSSGVEKIPYRFKKIPYKFYVMVRPSPDFTGNVFAPVEFFYELNVGDSISQVSKDYNKIFLPDVLIGAAILVVIFCVIGFFLRRKEIG